MKKLKYERAEIEVALLDPNLDIIVTSDTTTPTPPPLPPSESSFFIE